MRTEHGTAVVEVAPEPIDPNEGLGRQLARFPNGASLRLHHTGTVFNLGSTTDSNNSHRIFTLTDFLCDIKECDAENPSAIFSFSDDALLDAIARKFPPSEDEKIKAKKAEALQLAARLLVWKKIHDQKFTADQEFIKNSGPNFSRLKKSFGHVLVEGFLKNFGVLLFAALTKSFFDGDLNSQNPEHYSALSTTMWTGLFAAVCLISFYTVPNQYYYATRTISELDEKEMDPLYYHPTTIEDRLLELLDQGIDYEIGCLIARKEHVSDFRASDSSGDQLHCRLTAACVTIAEASDALCVALVLFLLKFRDNGASEETSYILTLTLLGIFGATLKASAAVSNYTAQAQNHRQAQEYFKTGQIVQLYEQHISLLNTEARQLRVYKALYIGLPLLFGLVHAGAAFKIEFMQESPMAVKVIVGLLLSLGAFAKTGTYDLARIAAAMGLEKDQAAAPYETKCLNTVAYVVAAQSPRIYDHWIKRSFLLGPSYYAGLCALMFKALEACIDGVIAPYTDALDTQVAGIEIKYILATVIAAWGAFTQTMQGVKSFNEKALQAEEEAPVTASTGLLARQGGSLNADATENRRLCCCV